MAILMHPCAIFVFHIVFFVIYRFGRFLDGVFARCVYFGLPIKYKIKI